MNYDVTDRLCQRNQNYLDKWEAGYYFVRKYYNSQLWFAYNISMNTFLIKFDTKSEN